MTLNDLLRPLPGWLVVVFAIGLGLAIGWSPWLAIPGLIGGLGIAIWMFGIDRDERESAPGSSDVASRPGGGNDGADADDGEGWRTLINAIDDPMLILIERRVIITNIMADDLFGHHLAGQDIRVGIRHPAVATVLEEYEASGTTQICQLKGFGGPERRWQMQIGTLGDDLSLVRLTDLSQMAASERARTDFVANASHELRTPIAAIIGFVETLSDRAAGDDAATRERFLGIMGTEARRMQQLVDDLISLSRIEADRYAPPDGTVDLAAMADNVARQITATGGAASGQILVEADAPGVQAVADAAQIEQVLYNLVGNALKYGRAGAPVRVGVADDNGMIRLTVVDQGEGIPARHLLRLTERFYRVDPGRSRARGGTGLGLAIVKNIVERHRGTLDFASVQGVGTTVTVRLPKASPSSSSSPSLSLS